VLSKRENLIIEEFKNLAQCKKKMGITNNEKWNTVNKSVFTMKLKFQFTDS